jgi:hypothetical protein
MTDTMTSQNIDLSSWDTVYKATVSKFWSLYNFSPSYSVIQIMPAYKYISYT